MIRSKAEITFQVFNYLFLVIIGLITLYPFWEVIRMSFAEMNEISRPYFSLWNREPTLNGYRHVLNNTYLWLGYRNTIIRVIAGISINLPLTLLTAYPLSKKNLPHRSFFTLLIIFTMFFSGGLIPEYLLIKTLNLDNTLLALILPGSVNTFLMLITRNYFMTHPLELEESAQIDGAGYVRILLWIIIQIDGAGYVRILLWIIIPISAPIIATVSLFYIVGHWNAWFDCLIYIRKPQNFILQAILRKIVIDAAPTFDGPGAENVLPGLYVETIKAASIVVATAPVMMIYPFLQKYFVKGMIIGSLKG